MQVIGGSGDVIRHNAIYANTGGGITLSNGGNGGIASPQLTTLTANLVSGAAQPLSVVEIYSDAGNEGRYYEGSAAGGCQRRFSGFLRRGFRGPVLTATATDNVLGTSMFSLPGTAMPVVTVQPLPQNVVVAGNASFAVTATGFPAPSYRWQRLSAGDVTWADLSDDSSYSGNDHSGTDGHCHRFQHVYDQFRCVVTNPPAIPSPMRRS